VGTSSRPPRAISSRGASTTSSRSKKASGSSCEFGPRGIEGATLPRRTRSASPESLSDLSLWLGPFDEVGGVPCAALLPPPHGRGLQRARSPSRMSIERSGPGRSRRRGRERPLGCRGTAVRHSRRRSLVEGPAAGKRKRGTGAAVAARASSVPPNRDVPVALSALIIARPRVTEGDTYHRPPTVTWQAPQSFLSKTGLGRTRRGVWHQIDRGGDSRWVAVAVNRPVRCDRTLSRRRRSSGRGPA